MQQAVTPTPNSSLSQAQKEARRYFPRGLIQPAGSFRFSMDALLLASFIKLKKDARLLELGTGSGPVALGALLNTPHAFATGLELEESLVASANQNATRLGFADNFIARKADVGEIRNFVQAESFDCVASNPPYRRLNEGRLPKHELRKNALFEQSASLDTFIAAAAFALKNGGAFYCIYPALRLQELFLCLENYRLAAKLILPLQAFSGKEIELLLLRATKNGKPGLKIKKPLLLYKKKGKNICLTQQALNFCPPLLCNAFQEL